MLEYVSSTTYCPQGNGQVESTNKVLKTLLTKLVNVNKKNQDEHLSTMLFSYRTTYKVITGYTPYQLMYGLHSLMPTKYIVLVGSGNEISFYIFIASEINLVWSVFFNYEYNFQYIRGQFPIFKFLNGQKYFICLSMSYIVFVFNITLWNQVSIVIFKVFFIL